MVYGSFYFTPNISLEGLKVASARGYDYDDSSEYFFDDEEYDLSDDGFEGEEEEEYNVQYSVI